MIASKEVRELADLLEKVLPNVTTPEKREAMAVDLLIRFTDNRSCMRNTLRWIIAYKANGWMPPDEP